VAQLPPRSSQEIEKLLSSRGFRLDRVGGEGHALWVHPQRGKPVPVPRNRSAGEIPRGTVKAILRQAGISRDNALEFWGIN